MGDPTGVGPEVVAKALLREEVYEWCRPLVVGDKGVFERIIQELDLPLEVTEGEGGRGKLPLLPVGELPPLPWGRPQREAGEAAYRYILKAVELIERGEAQAMVTGPVSKEAIQMAGYPFSGHTELLAQLSHTEEYVMMLAGPRLRVSLVTIHIPLSQVPSAISKERVLKCIEVTERGLKEDFGIASPRLAVAALNPHGGEGGLFGEEEEREIGPAVREAQEKGIEVQGPFPADSLFHEALSGGWDAVVAMYHDQGLIPLKMLHFRDGVNVTLGLPFVRTSVDHGTAFPIAGKGVADPTSMYAAIQMAAQILTHSSG